jgi:hypothetical protein
MTAIVLNATIVPKIRAEEGTHIAQGNLAKNQVGNAVIAISPLEIAAQNASLVGGASSALEREGVVTTQVRRVASTARNINHQEEEAE